MTYPLVSIIIPLYNGAAYLPVAVESALMQTWPNKEIIIVDDGSTDNSLQIANGFISETVKVLQQENKGGSAARNRGLAEAKGMYIQFLDADDLLKNDKIELQLKAIKDKPGMVSYCSNVNFFDGEKIDDRAAGCYLQADYDDGKNFLIDLYGGKDAKHTGGYIPQHSWLVPRPVIDAAGLWNTDLAVDDDGEFFCRVALNAKGIKYVAGAACYYRRHQHKNNLSAQKTLQSWQSVFGAIKLKQQHIGNSKTTGHLLANQAMQLLSNVYPKHPLFCRQIEQFIDEMGGATWLPYQEGPHKIFRKLFGWKAVRLMSYYKNTSEPDGFK